MVFPAHPRTDDPNSPIEAWPLIRSDARESPNGPEHSRPDTLVQDRTTQPHRFLLQRTAGPYIGSKADDGFREPCCAGEHEQTGEHFMSADELVVLLSQFQFQIDQLVKNCRFGPRATSAPSKPSKKPPVTPTRWCPPTFADTRGSTTTA